MIRTFAYILVFLCMIASPTLGLSQDVGYFMLGESELRNTDIYTILETKDLRLYIGTNEGVYQYKNGRMLPIQPAINQKGVSIFDLKENSRGEVFCHNFAGQIFQIIGDRLVLFNELETTEMASTVQLFVDLYDRLIFVADNVYVVEKDTILQMPVDGRKSSLGATQLPDGTILRYYFEEGSIEQVSSKGTESRSADLQLSRGFLYQTKDGLVGSKTLDEVQYRSANNGTDRGFHNTYFQFDENEIWRRGGKQGVELLRYDDKGDWIVDRQMFADRFISHITKSRSGGLILGTFGQGLIVIPTLENQRHNLSRRLKAIQSIACDQANNVYLSDRQMGIYRLDSTHSLLEIERIDGVVPSRVFCSSGSKVGKDSSLLYYQSDVNLWSTKSFQYLPENTILLGTSNLVARKGAYQILADSLWEPHPQSGFEKLKHITGRVNAATYAPHEGKLFVATPSQLLVFLPDGRINSLQYLGSSIMCNQLIYYENKIWTHTVKHGLLCIENGQVSLVLSTNDDLAGDAIRKIEVVGERCYILQKNSFSVYDLPSNSLSYIGKPQGVDITSIEDFDVSEDRLWIAYSDNLVSLPLESKLEVQPYVKLKVDSVKVGNIMLSDTTTRILPPNENMLRVHVELRGLSYEDEAKIRYRLRGFSDIWIQVAPLDNIVNYRYLPPGNYTLELQVLWRGRILEDYQQSFVIGKPIWKKLWFLLLCLFLAAFIGVSIVRYQIHRLSSKNAQLLKQKVLESELIESELKALRSQMNPHFIFNTLNAIQDIVLNNDSNTAYDQLERFSKLIRIALNHSNKPTITVEEEVDFLSTYLSLEQLRFGNELQYIIQANIPQDLKIPTQIIQPFVENAIVHGLFHKEGDKKLEVVFALQGESITIAVKDNGIGRQQALDIQQRQHSSHQSFALAALRSRFQILSEKHQVDLQFTIEDTYDSKDTPTGTVVKVVLPALLS